MKKFLSAKLEKILVKITRGISSVRISIPIRHVIARRNSFGWNEKKSPKNYRSKANTPLWHFNRIPCMLNSKIQTPILRNSTRTIYLSMHKYAMAAMRWFVNQIHWQFGISGYVNSKESLYEMGFFCWYFELNTRL